MSANTKYPCLQRQRDQEATKLSLLDLTLHLGSIELLQYVWWIYPRRFQSLYLSLLPWRFFCLWELHFRGEMWMASRQRSTKSWEKNQTRRKKIRSCVCCSNSFAPKNWCVFKEEELCFSTLHVIKGKELRRPDKQTAGFLFQREKKSNSRRLNNDGINNRSTFHRPILIAHPFCQGMARVSFFLFAYFHCSLKVF